METGTSRILPRSYLLSFLVLLQEKITTTHIYFNNLYTLLIELDVIRVSLKPFL